MHKIKSIFKILTASALSAALFINPTAVRAESTSILYGSWSVNTTTHAGSVVEFQVVDASGISFDLTSYGSWRLSVDGGTPQTVSSGWYKLDPGVHEISLFTESIPDHTTGVTFKSAQIYDGRYLPSVKEQYLFVGDSLWEGTNSVGILPGQDSFINSIPYQLAKDMNVVPVNVAAPGSGLYMTEYYGTLQQMFAQNEINANPTKIFISAGTNDLKIGIDEESEFQAMQGFVDTIRAKYPFSAIYFLVPFYEQCYSGAIHRLSDVTVIETAGWPMVFTDGFHPDGNSAKFAADMIAGILRGY